MVAPGCYNDPMNMQDVLGKMVREGVASGAFPSATAAVGARGSVLAMACAGRLYLPDGPEVNLETRYDLASLTKIVSTSMLALRAIEDGDLTLFDTVGRFYEAPDDKRDITVKQIMTHTGGFVPAFDLRRGGFDPGQADEAIDPQTPA